MKKSMMMAAVLLAGAAMFSPASAVTINVGDVGASGTTSLQGFVDVGQTTQAISGLTGSLFLQYNGVTNGGLTWNFGYNVTNTSSGNTTASSIGAFGLATTPNATGAASTGLYDLAILNPQFPNVGGHGAGIEVCFSDGNNSCNGNGTTLTEGQSAAGTFSLTFGSQLSSLTLDTAYLRFQGINSTSPHLVGDSGVANNTNVVVNPTASVPGPIVGAGIPGIIAALGLAGFGWRRRRRSMFA